jgi:hypothetical protein
MNVKLEREFSFGFAAGCVAVASPRSERIDDCLGLRPRFEVFCAFIFETNV